MVFISDCNGILHCFCFENRYSSATTYAIAIMFQHSFTMALRGGGGGVRSNETKRNEPSELRSKELKLTILSCLSSLAAISWGGDCTSSVVGGTVHHRLLGGGVHHGLFFFFGGGYDSHLSSSNPVTLSDTNPTPPLPLKQR